MKAIVYQKYGGPEVLRLEEIRQPIPESNEILVKVHSVSINPFEWHHMRGTPRFARLSMGFFKPKHHVLGMDVAGTVISTGQKVSQFKEGDEVFGYSNYGGLAEYVCISGDLTLPKPYNLTFAEAASIPLAGVTALQSVRNVVQLEPGQKVLINGASGGVGAFTVQIAKSYEAEITAVCSTKNVALVQSIGADHVVDYTKKDVTQCGQHFDLLIDNVGNLSVGDHKKLLKPGGTSVVVGYTSMKCLLPVMMKGKAVKGKIGILSAKTTLKDLIYLKGLTENGKVKPVIDRQYSLEDIEEAMTYLEAGHASGKVVITVANGGADKQQN